MQRIKIGVYDSGVGGLTVLKQLLKKIPYGIDFFYFADTARLPYGSKPQEMVRGFVFEIFDFFRHLNVDAIVTACNTTDSLLTETEKKSLWIPFFSIIEPAVRYLRDSISGKNSVAIIGTEVTVKRSVYLRKLIIDGNISRISQKACPLFVPLVEEGLSDSELTERVVAYYLKEIKAFSPDFLILGCTHYSYLKNAVSKYLGNKTQIVDPAEHVSGQVIDWIGEIGDTNKSRISFYVTGSAEDFKRKATFLLGSNGELKVNHVDLERLGEIINL
ncbi:glutamate racemase [Kosmotoga arenicorallina S304]|uniref:Glutamate racemase n=1 Tax=Kosmotoga arenicorallina S304 TaxID=1453497 RepID=A0A176K3R7_9BACT|nr:glutamate racemase [Kosmotoga arenicorallina]OAA31757.1 glutamate racemase [Kosmotoga arenicorallina S304]